MPRPSERTLVVVNFNAARARRAWPGIREQLTRAGLRFEVDAPASPDETEPAVRRALCEGFRTIAVVGGDGTLSAAARGFFDTHEGSREPSSLNPSEPHAPPDTPALPPSSELCAPPAPVNSSAALAVLPAGTGDDFARGLAGRRAHLDEWLRRLVAHCRRSEEDGAGSARSVDVLCAEVDGGARRFVCLNAATLGVGAEVASRVAAQGPA
ncbi:MAG TPA: diacylglycerol kinase family protein, partial [Pyrinomonadaceae bacterium]|nr:diacylglycerol kinase family protein [Pyrinomonadaceae bacterium]